jgi:hypothetical protein
MTLHDAIVAILREKGRAMTTAEVAVEVNNRGNYRKRDGTPVTAFQIHGRTRNYSRLFDRSGSTVALAGASRENPDVPQISLSNVNRGSGTNAQNSAAVLDQLLSSPSLLAGRQSAEYSGFYAWWVREDCLSDGVPRIPLVRPACMVCPWALLYVGICPRRKSARTVHDRLDKDHGGHSIGASTFRFSLAALLRSKLGLLPLSGHDRARVLDERPLSLWMQANCGVTTARCERPWECEEAVVERLCPPLNLKPGFHDFRFSVVDARRRLEAECGLA